MEMRNESKRQQTAEAHKVQEELFANWCLIPNSAPLAKYYGS